MSGTLTIYRRELASLFFSPLAWILLLLALLANGFFFVLYLNQANGEVTYALELALGGGWPFWSLLVFLPPLLAMRLLAEEARTGTLEFLLTAPVSDAAVVCGKFLGATTFMAVLWLAAPIYAGAIHTLGVAPDWGAVLGGYIGAVLASGLFVSIGLFASSLTSTPLVAAFLAFMADLWWLVLPTAAEYGMEQVRSLLAGFAGGVERAQVWVRTALHQMNVVSHFQSSFLHGVLDTAEVVFFATWTGFFLFLTVRSLEARRWRG